MELVLLGMKWKLNVQKKGNIRRRRIFFDDKFALERTGDGKEKRSLQNEDM